MHEAAERAREVSSPSLVPGLPSCRCRDCRDWALCVWDTVPTWPQASVAPQPVPLHPAEPGSQIALLYPLPASCPLPVPSSVPRGCGDGWCRWSASARRGTWVPRCRHPRLSWGAVWVPCGRNIKSHGSVETLAANRRAMQGLIRALQRAAEPARLPQQVTAGRA